MSPFAIIRRTILGLALVIGGLWALNVPANDAAAQIFLDECDSAYPDFCIPPVEEAGDLNCPDLSFSNFTVLDPDPHGFDTDLDGIGCESAVPAGSTATDEGEEGLLGGLLAADCDVSYPDACIPPPPPDLNCDDVGFALEVIYDESAGATDPHNLDPDGNGRGCESYGP